MRKKKTVAAKHCREGRIPYLPQSFSLKTCATALERYTDLRQLAGTRLLLDALCKQMTFEEAHTAVTEFDIRNPAGIHQKGLGTPTGLSPDLWQLQADFP